MFMRLNKRGQSTLEYAVIIAVVVAGLIAMQVYFRRGFMGRMRSSTDDIGDQFEPEQFTSTYTTTTRSVSNEALQDGTTTTAITEGWSETNGSETVADYDTTR